MIPSAEKLHHCTDSPLPRKKKMADENMDSCEYIFSHELAMRRLLSFLRQSQSYCTDTECIDDSMPSITGSTTASTSTEPNNFVMMTVMWLFISFMLYMLRPNSLRNRRDDLQKPHRDEPDQNGRFPPAPPPAAN